MSVRDIDLGWNKILRNMQEVGSKSVKVGIQAGDKAADGKHDLAFVAGVHEFGTERVPQRSFLRTGIDNNKGKINRLRDSLAGRIVDGSATPRGALDIIGLAVTGMIQEQITDGDYVPLAPSTVRAKKSSKPLIDTGTMRRSVRHVIEDD